VRRAGGILRRLGGRFGWAFRSGVSVGRLGGASVVVVDDAAASVELLVRTRRGDEVAARALWARYGPRMTALARGMLRQAGREHAAGDAVQAVFVAVLGRPVSELKRVRDVGAYLARSVRHAALNQIREHGRRQRREREAGGAAAGAGEAGGGGSLGVEDCERERLMEALDGLPDGAREVLVLKHLAGLTFDQVAEVLELPRGTVSGRYRAAVIAVRVALGERDEADGSGGAA
jgi:RNA polymerase sigma-70 factor (ECF subfamily)